MVLVHFPNIVTETIAAFRSADDVESDSLPLFPWQRQTEGAYHGLINMINNILPLAEPKILKSFSQKVSDFVGLWYSSSYPSKGVLTPCRSSRFRLAMGELKQAMETIWL